MWRLRRFTRQNKNNIKRAINDNFISPDVNFLFGCNEIISNRMQILGNLLEGMFSSPKINTIQGRQIENQKKKGEMSHRVMLSLTMTPENARITQHVGLT